MRTWVGSWRIREERRERRIEGGGTLVGGRGEGLAGLAREFELGGAAEEGREGVRVSGRRGLCGVGGMM